MLIRVLIDGLSRSARSLEQRTGITNAQLFLLQQLADGEGLSVTELAQRARTQQSTVSIVVGRLVRARLVRSVRSESDGRRAVLTLTPSARRLLRNAPDPPTAAVLAALEKLSATDAKALAQGMRALVGALGLEQQPAPLLFEPAGRRKSPSST